MKCRLADVDLEYDVSGASPSPTLLLVHGFPHDRTIWSPQMRALSTSYRCVSVDLRGFGQSSPAPPYSMDRYADDLAALLDAIGERRAVVAGLSMGGYIAFAMWRRCPERVQGFVLADTRPGIDSAAALQSRHDMIDRVRRGGVRAASRLLGAGQIGATTRTRQPELETVVTAMACRASNEGIVGALGAMIARPDSTDTLATITVPTLIVVGEEDAISPPVEAERMHDLVSGSRLAVVRGAGHLSNMERPAAFNAVVSEWVATACDPAHTH